MQYATYEFYTTNYHGDALPEASFSTWEARAQDKLDWLTFHHITEDALEENAEAIGKATCAIAEYLYKVDKAQQQATDPEGGNVKSKSSGGESISFGATDTVYSKAMGDANLQKAAMRDIATEYLAHTGLLYAGAPGI